MASLRTQLGKKLSYHSKTVEFGGQSYLMGGLPSVDLMIDTMVPGKDDENLARMWNVQFWPSDDGGIKVQPMPETFKGSSIGQIRCVCKYAIAPDGEQPYTLAEIAEIYATDPLLFAALYGGAMEIVSASNPIEIAAGKSPADEPAT